MSTTLELRIKRSAISKNELLLEKLIALSRHISIKVTEIEKKANLGKPEDAKRQT